MKIFFTAALLIAVNFSLVAGGCNKNDKSTTDSKEKCEYWWRKMLNDYDSNSDIKKCISLIQATCSTFLYIEKDIEVTHKVYRHSVEWKFKQKAMKDAWRNNWVCYTIYKKSGVCKDDYGLGNCASWWSAAMVLKNVDHVVERCINRIKQNCPSDLTQISKYTEPRRRLLSKVEVTKLTYRYRNGDEVAFRSYA